MKDPVVRNIFGFHTLVKNLPKGEGLDDTGDLTGEPRLESEAKLLKACKGDAINEDLKLGVEAFFFVAEGGAFSSPKLSFSLDIFLFVVVSSKNLKMKC